jgi:hypothetical protein
VHLGSLGEFETCPDWVPVMDTGQQFAGSLSKQWATMGSIKGLTGWRKFETCPMWGATPVARFCGLSFCFFNLPVRARDDTPERIRTRKLMG